LDCRPSKFYALAALLAALFISSRSGAAGDTPQQIAEAHLRAGLKLYEQSSYEAARLEFLQAQAVFPRPSLLRNLALCELKTNRPLEAIQHLRTYLADPTTTADKRENAKKNLDEAFAKTGHVSVRAADGATISLDGQAQLGTTPLREPIDTLPGRHVLEARLADRSTTREVEAAAGVVVEVDLRFEEKATSASPTAGPSVGGATAKYDPGGPPSEPAPSFWTTRHAVGVTVGGLALVAAGVGGAFLVARNGHVSDGKDALAVSSRPCSQPASATCAQYDGARDGIKSTEFGAAVSFGAFVALGVTAAVLILWPEQKLEARVRLLPVGRDLSLMGTF
jgi:hypothetical protein